LSVDALYEDDQLIIINDINPVAEKHFLAIPCGNYVNHNLSLSIYLYV
jgi:diadenosine tetraphosphate (Ap4A) HIT family hydrolase